MTQAVRARRRRRGGAAGFSPASVSGLHIWLDASQESYANGAAVPLMTDKSGNGRNATASGSAQPLFTTGIFNGNPVLRFDGSDDFIIFGDVMSALTQGEIFIVAQHMVPPASGLGSLWEMSGGSFSTYFPFTDGAGYDSCGTTARVDGMVLAGAAESRFVYNVSSAAGLITNRLNGSVLSNRVTNVVSWPTAPRIGQNAAGAMKFDVAEFIMYSSVLSAGDRTAVKNSLASKYGTP